MLDRNRHLVGSAELDLADRRDMPAISGQHPPLRYLVPHANFPNARHSTLDFAVDRTKVAAIQSLSIHGTLVAVPAEPNFLEQSDVTDGFGISGWNATDKLALARVRGLGVPAAAARHRRKKVNKDSPSQRHTFEKIVVRKSVVGHIKWSVRMVNDAVANFKPRKP